MGRKRDRFWEYAEVLNRHFKCNYCKCVFPGGVSKIKSHLAGVEGLGIVICEAVPEDVQKEAYQATHGTNKKLKTAATSNSDNESETSSNFISTIHKEKIVTQSKEKYVAEIVLDDVVHRLLDKVFSFSTEHSFNEELINFLDKLMKIKVVLYYAQQRQGSDVSVRIWLMKLRDVAYEVDNVLDEFRDEILQQKVQSQNQMMDHVCSFSFGNPDRVMVTKQLLDEIVNDVASLGLRMESVNSIDKTILDENIDSFLMIQKWLEEGSVL